MLSEGEGEGEGGDEVYGGRSDFGFGFGFGSGRIPAAVEIGFLPPSAVWPRGIVEPSAGGYSAGLGCGSAVVAGTGLG